jgi:hypothetical protein
MWREGLSRDTTVLFKNLYIKCVLAVSQLCVSNGLRIANGIMDKEDGKVVLNCVLAVSQPCASNGLQIANCNVDKGDGKVVCCPHSVD